MSKKPRGPRPPQIRQLSPRFITNRMEVRLSKKGPFVKVDRVVFLNSGHIALHLANGSISNLLPQMGITCRDYVPGASAVCFGGRTTNVTKEDGGFTR